MEKDLVARWVEVVKPFSIEELKDRFSASLCATIEEDDETKAAVKAAVKSISVEKIRSILLTFAEEHFSEDALAAAVAFFESEPGRRYYEERKRVTNAALDAINKYMLECIRGELGS